MNSLIVNKEDELIRLDKYFIKYVDSFSRSEITNFIKDGYVFINGKVCTKAAYLVKENDKIDYDFSNVRSTDIKEEDIPLDIVYEDDDLLVINKEQGMVVHPAPGHYEGTLVNALIKHCPLSVVGGVNRPGIVHRIDKDTSGLLVVAKNDKAHAFLSEQLKDHTMHREYYALVKGHFTEKEGKIDLPISRSKKNKEMMSVDPKGKYAVTYFTKEKEYKNHTLLNIRLETGRTHQIRVHMAYIKHPVEGDVVYGCKPHLYTNGQMLHAYQLTFIHPTIKKEVSFKAPLPSWFTDFLNNLE